MLSLQATTRRILGRNILRIHFSSAPPKVEAVSVDKKLDSTGKNFTENVEKPVQFNRKKLVSSAFNSIKKNKKDAEIDDAISNAKTLSEILSIADKATINRKQALKIVSILSEWSQNNRIKVSDFENDSRFLAMCQTLGGKVHLPIPSANKASPPVFRTEDLSLVMGVAGDDEAAKLIGSISLPQMVTVLSALSQQKRRSIPLLRSLSFNISISSDTLNLKQCADVLYSMTSLNFVDTVLVARISADIQSELPKNKDRPAVVGSIITSLGLMKHKDTDLVDILTAWVIQHKDICRPDDILSLFQTLAMIDYPTMHADELKELIGTINTCTFSSEKWLSFVWSLVLLDLATADHIDSVLSPEFIEKMVREIGGEPTPASKMKLLNINAAARILIPNYDRSLLLPNSSLFRTPIANTKSKSILTAALNDALKGLFNSESYLRKHVNTGMGFIIDAECVLDKKLKPLSFDENQENGIKCALIVQDFHDFCTGAHNSPTGLGSLTMKLLTKSGYTVLVFPHFEFKNSDNLLKRVKYVESKLKSAVMNDS